MLTVPSPRIGIPSVLGLDGASTGGGLISVSVSANTKSAWQELTASAPKSNTIIVSAGHSVINSVQLFDIGIGAGGSEVPLIENLLLHCGSSFRNEMRYEIPVTIPAGSRISIRGQRDDVSFIGRFAIEFVQRFPQMTTGIFSAYGANVSASRGTVIDPGATANAKGAWTQLSASVQRIRRLWLAFGTAISTRVSSRVQLDIGVGAASSETVILPDIVLSDNEEHDGIFPSVIGPIPINIPLGARLAVRAQSGNNSSPSRQFDIIAYGVA